LLLVVVCQPFAAFAQETDARTWAVDVANGYRIESDVTYTVSDGHESKLDIIVPYGEPEPRPTLLYIHGGGWVQGNKEMMTLSFLPYLEMGFSVVNVEYRLADVALAPAAVEDTRCALRWVHDNADRYGFDRDKIVVSGHSAGGHLSLMTGLLPAEAGFDRRCPAINPDAPGPVDSHEPEMPVAGIINWFGVTDVADLVDGPNAKAYAVMWFGAMSDRMDLARRVSPLEYVRPGLPPVLTIHGNADALVPYEHGARLHEALLAAGGVSVLHTVPGGGHGFFAREANHAADAAIREFLHEHVFGANSHE
jgi:acetyl esterase/lipase